MLHVNEKKKSIGSFLYKLFKEKKMFVFKMSVTVNWLLLDKLDSS